MKNKIFFAAMMIFTYFILVSGVFAYTESGHIGLLTVSESDNISQEIGGVANLYLTIKPGTGRIFIDSFPLSKVDTQITTRFAAELACDFLDKDCSGLDFFYTIRANSAIVGGPSAGAASTVLTIAMLDEQPLDNFTVMTGTINSGNLIGPVAGISAKTLAAQQFGFKKALIPKWDLANDTPSANLSIKIIPVSTLEEALFQFTGKNYSTSDGNITLSDDYTKIMKDIALNMCAKYGSLENNDVIMPNLTNVLAKYGINIQNISAPPYLINFTNNITDNITQNISFRESILNNSEGGLKDFYGLAQNALDRKEYYSAASFCFGGNVLINSAYLGNQTNLALKLAFANLLSNISKMEQTLSEKKLSTIPVLETYMVVSERVLDAKNALSKIDPDNISAADLAYAQERFDTAVVWSKFFALSGTQYSMDEEQLRKVCTNKLSEAEERINYLQLFFPKIIDRTDLRQAYAYFDDQQYALCIFTASKAKADVDVILGALYVNDVNLQGYIDEKLTAARKAIFKQEKNDVFPILGYSYYEYANSLRRSENYSTLMYAEYALEISNLDMYFAKEKTAAPKVSYYIDYGWIATFMLGAAAGIIFAVIFSYFFIRASKHDARNSQARKSTRNIKRNKKR